MKLVCCLDNKIITSKCESSCIIINSNVIMCYSYVDGWNNFWDIAHLGNFIIFRHGEILAIWLSRTIIAINQTI